MAGSGRTSSCVGRPIEEPVHLHDVWSLVGFGRGLASGGGAVCGDGDSVVQIAPGKRAKALPAQGWRAGWKWGGRWADFLRVQIAMLSFKSMPGTKTAQDSDPKVRVSLPHTPVLQQEHALTHTEPRALLEHTKRCVVRQGSGACSQ